MLNSSIFFISLIFVLSIHTSSFAQTRLSDEELEKLVFYNHLLHHSDDFPKALRINSDGCYEFKKEWRGNHNLNGESLCPDLLEGVYGDLDLDGDDDLFVTLTHARGNIGGFTYYKLIFLYEKDEWGSEFVYHCAALKMGSAEAIRLKEETGNIPRIEKIENGICFGKQYVYNNANSKWPTHYKNVSYSYKDCAFKMILEGEPIKID